MEHRRSGHQWAAMVTAVVSGVLIIAAALLPSVAPLQQGAALLLPAARLIAGLLLLLASLTFLAYHVRRVTFGRDGLTQHAALVAGFLLMVVPGLFIPETGGGRAVLPDGLDTPFLLVVVDQVYLPIAASLFALPAFFTLRAMIDGIAARRPAALTMVVVALAVLLLPLFASAQWLPVVETGQWLQTALLTPTVRALVLSGALGALVAGVRVLTGRDQPYAEQDS